MQDRQTPLHLAAKENHVTCVEYLLSVGADTEDKDEVSFYMIVLDNICMHLYTFIYLKKIVWIYGAAFGD